MLFFFRDSSYLFLLIGTSIFMSGYISIAAIVAAIVNNVAQDAYRGTVNGIFNSFQYIGNFVGALAAGAIWGFSEISVWILLIGLGLIGCVIIALSHPVMKSN
jgi:MFS family permease